MKEVTIYSRFREWVSCYPDAVAIVEDRRSFTYAELDCMADRLLMSFPEAASHLVGIVMSHRAEMIAAMFAVLKSGAAYVPAEPSLPPDRIDYMMTEAEVSFIIDDTFCDKALAGDQNDISVAAADRSRPDSIAYVLFTSGTTGRPKGVVIENHSVVNYAEAFEVEFHTGPGDTMLQYSVCSFDIFVEEVFTTLLNGATLAIPSDDVRQGSIDRLMDFVRRHNVTEISGFPYLLAELNKHHSLPPSLRLLISGGDTLRHRYIDRLKDKGVMIYNTYGPSETTVCCTYQRCDNIEPLPAGTYPVGHPVRNVGVEILDHKLRPVCQGMIGEICITGAGVGRGYLGTPPEQANFIILGDGRRLYRSGDLGYVLPSGEFVFLHRRDEQVMILGKRVEPGEVENVLNQSPDVDRGVVCPFSDEEGLSYLVAYFVPKSPRVSLHEIKRWLKSKLTDFMVPEFFVAMKAMPLTVRGKVDRRALPRVLKEGRDLE